MKKVSFLVSLVLLFMSGCSTYSAKSTFNNSVAQPKKSQIQIKNIHSNKRSHKMSTLIIDSTVIGVASVSLGSLLLHDLGGSFKFTNEGGFAEDTKFGGMDKLGHAWYTNTISDLLYSRIQPREGNSHASALKAAGISFGIMTLIEVADGFATTTTGFSSGDLMADAVGASLSYVRNTNPKIQKLVDFRLEYLPNHTRKKLGTGEFYSDQKYLLAWKLSGLNRIKKTNPLRFLEFHTGYYARGFSTIEKAKGDKKERNLYVGLGINLNELFFAKKNGKRSRFKEAGSGFVEHIQLPYTYGSLVKEQ